MGRMIYETAPALEINDRALRHLHAAITEKLRLHDAFSFMWDDEPDIGGDRSAEAVRHGEYGAIWISQKSSLYFSFDGPLQTPLNRDWVRLLLAKSSGGGTLRLLPEPIDEGVH